MNTFLQLPMFEAVKIPITQGRLAIVDPVDADLLAFTWHIAGGRYAGYGRHPNDVFIHRIVAERILGRDLTKGEVVDHINGNSLDNRRANLRVCTHAQNCANKIKNKNNSTGYKGVYFQRNRGWYASIKVNNRQISLGDYNDPISAARAYDAAAIEHFGEFACTNVMLGLIPMLAGVEVFSR